MKRPFTVDFRTKLPSCGPLFYGITMIAVLTLCSTLAIAAPVPLEVLPGSSYRFDPFVTCNHTDADNGCWVKPNEWLAAQSGTLDATGTVYTGYGLAKAEAYAETSISQPDAGTGSGLAVLAWSVQLRPTANNPAYPVHYQMSYDVATANNGWSDLGFGITDGSFALTIAPSAWDVLGNKWVSAGSPFVLGWTEDLSVSDVAYDLGVTLPSSIPVKIDITFAIAASAWVSPSAYLVVWPFGEYADSYGRGVYNAGLLDFELWADGSIPIPQPVPEPSTALLVGAGVVALSGFRRKFRK